MKFQYLNSLYNEVTGTKQQFELQKVFKDWLLANVGEEYDARKSLEVKDWAWSLTRYSSDGVPRGIYFTRDEDAVAFRLRFDIGDGR